MSVIKIFGLPRSCTNITEAVLKTNFKVRVLTNFPCWKHGRNTHQGLSLHDEKRKIHTDELKYVICSKHPYDWLFSLFNFENNSKRQKNTIDEFIRQSCWHYRNDDRGPKSGNPIDAYNELSKQWFSEHTDPTILQHVKHQDLLLDQIEVAKRLEENFGLIRKVKDLVPVANRINPGLKNSKQAFKVQKHNFSKKTIKYINNKLDKEVVNLLGYTL